LGDDVTSPARLAFVAMQGELLADQREEAVLRGVPTPKVRMNVALCEGGKIGGHRARPTEPFEKSTGYGSLVRLG